MNAFFWSKRKSAGFVVPAKPGRRRKLSVWRQGLGAGFVLIVLFLVVAVGMGKSGLAKILSSDDHHQVRILLVGRTAEKISYLGIASWAPDQSSVVWLPEWLGQTNDDSSTDLDIRASISQKLALPLTGKIELKSESAQSWPHDLDIGFWPALKLAKPDRDLYYRLWLASRGGQGLVLTAGDAPQLRQEMQLTPLFTAFNRDCPIMVINTVPVTGLGSRYSMMLEREGLRVVRLDSDQTQQANSQVWFDADLADRCQKVADVMQSLFSPDLAQPRPDLESEYRASIVVFLGQDSQALSE